MYRCIIRNSYSGYISVSSIGASTNKDIFLYLHAVIRFITAELSLYPLEVQTNRNEQRGNNEKRHLKQERTKKKECYFFSWTSKYLLKIQYSKSVKVCQKVVDIYSGI